MIYNYQIDTIKPFMQYRKNQCLTDFCEAYTKKLQEYFTYLNEAISALSMYEPTKIVPQLSQHYYGLPFISGGGTTSNNKYDTGILYDNGLIYDDNNSGASVDFRYLRRYLKFLFDYKQPVFNVDMIMSFLADFCECQKSDIDLEIVNKFTLHFKIPNSEAGRNLVQIKSTMGENFIGFPYGNDIITLGIKDS